MWWVQHGYKLFHFSNRVLQCICNKLINCDGYNKVSIYSLFLTEAFTVNFGLHSGDSVIWLASNDYTTYPTNGLYRGAIVAGGEKFCSNKMP